MVWRKKSLKLDSIIYCNKKEVEINKEIDAKFKTINDICMQAHEYANCE